MDNTIPPNNNMTPTESNPSSVGTLIGILIILAVIIIGGLYLWKSKSKGLEYNDVVNEKPVVNTVNEISPTSTSEEILNDINIPDIESEINNI